MDAKELKDLLRFVRDAGFLEFEIEQEGLRMRVVRDHPADGRGAPVAAPVPGPQAPPAAAAVPLAAPAPAGPEIADPLLFEQAAPMVGTFYRSSRPGAEPFVKPGDRVTPGQVVCIIEAMKLMNEIEAEVPGTIVEVLPQNAQPVEYGEVLFRIRKD